MGSTRDAQPISWKTAKKVAGKISGSEPFSHSYLGASVEQDFIDLTKRAEEFIVDATGLEADGPARVRVTDRTGWVKANVSTFERVLRPLTEKFSGKRVSPVGTQVTGAQLGLVLGWMSTRVLGQYDLVLERDNHPEEQDYLYYVSPNVLALEKRYAFPPKEFRLWIALHECTHRAQFTGVPWMPDHFRSLVHSLLEDVDTDANKLTDSLKNLLSKNDDSTKNGGLFAAVASPEQREILNKLTGMMALLEGHADVTMSRAAGHFIPGAERFDRVMHQRRTNSAGITKVFQRLLGMEAKLRQYIEGAGFVRAVEKDGGRPLFDLVWQRPENLPTADEIREPQTWISRMKAASEPQPA
jgi:coenzyme F420 biosynthesis associated uncharacterized protein